MLDMICFFSMLICVLFHILSKSKLLKYSTDYFFIFLLCENAIIEYFNGRGTMVSILLFIVAILGYPIFLGVINREEKCERKKVKFDNIKVGKKTALIVLGEVIILLACFYLQFIQIDGIEVLLIIEKIVSIVLVFTIIFLLHKKNSR